MDKEKKNNEGMFQMFHKSGFKFKNFEEMAEMMRSCCLGEGGMMDCCSMMRKMMEEGKWKETKENNKDTGEPGNV